MVNWPHFWVGERFLFFILGVFYLLFNLFFQTIF
jgi:hypothetical protein